MDKKTTPVSSVNSDTSSGKSFKKYYTINKEEDKHYLLMEFYCNSGSLSIENTKEDKGKQNKILIIVLIVVLCAAVIFGTICVIIQRRKKMAAKAAMKAAAYSQGMGMGMGMGMAPPMASGYGSNIMMNNLPPPGNLSSQPVAYSRVNNNATQLATPTPNSINPPSSGGRFGKIGKKF